jgi:SAM-dependent methyltransferase
MDMAEYWTTEDGDPRAVYHDVLIALDERRQINNGQPSLWAFLLDQLDVAVGEQALHLGCGTGYYTAVVAELVGQMGKITAIEIDPDLAEKARAALMPWPQITVSNADGANRQRSGEADSAGRRRLARHNSAAGAILPAADQHRPGHHEPAGRPEGDRN